MATGTVSRTMHKRSPTASLSFFVQTGFAGLIGFALLGHAGAVIDLAFTPLAVLVAVFLFFRAPAQYPAFCMWLWMLTPLVRRLVDWQTDYHVVSMVMLAPLLASALSAWTAISFAPRLIHRDCLPFSIVLAVCSYGLLVGTLLAGPASAIFAWLTWVAPVFMGIHILAKPSIAETSAKALFGAMAWGTLVIGSYGVWQYFKPQPWDIYWMLASKFTTAGLPLPQQIRVFSTMNSPAPFGYVMMAGLLVLLAGGGKIRWFAGVAGITAFMLSLVRSAWGGLIIALGIIALRSPIKQRAKYIALGGVLVVLALPLLTVGPIATVVQARLNSISAIQNDSSYRDRTSFYSDFLETALTTPLGTGLGTTGLASRLNSSDNALGSFGNFDSGVMDVFFTFGWLGAILLLAVGRIILSALRGASGSSVAVTGAAIAGGTAAQVMFADTLIGASGMLVFPFAALAVAQSKQSMNSTSRVRSSRLYKVRRRFLATAQPAIGKNPP